MTLPVLMAAIAIASVGAHVATGRRTFLFLGYLTIPAYGIALHEGVDMEVLTAVGIALTAIGVPMYIKSLTRGGELWLLPSLPTIGFGICILFSQCCPSQPKAADAGPGTSGTEVVDDLVTREVCLDGLVFRKTTDGNGNGGLVQVFVPDGGRGSTPKTCR